MERNVWQRVEVARKNHRALLGQVSCEASKTLQKVGIVAVVGHVRVQQRQNCRSCCSLQRNSYAKNPSWPNVEEYVEPRRRLDCRLSLVQRILVTFCSKACVVDLEAVSTKLAPSQGFTFLAAQYHELSCHITKQEMGRNGVPPSESKDYGKDHPADKERKPGALSRSQRIERHLNQDALYKGNEAHESRPEYPGCRLGATGEVSVVEVGKVAHEALNHRGA
mmetsp:Transcript_23981/g.56437  ORF Transcript_23981/g.56437 Transcript_23981/m.56437 type:complete len:222 (-) Transcript_23981:270-935(-)